MATLVVYPDAGSGSTTVDGYARYFSSGASLTFSEIKAIAGNSSSATSTITSFANLGATTTTDRFKQMLRGGFTFDTSSIGSGSTISSATFSLRGTAKNNPLGGTLYLDVVSFSPADDNDIVNSDYANFGSTELGSVNYTSFSTSGFNDIVLNTDGKSNIVKDGISGFGSITSWDREDSFGGTWSSSATTVFSGYMADQTGTTTDPKLTIVYTEASSDFVIADADSTTSAENIDLEGNFIIADLSSSSNVDNIDIELNSGVFSIDNADSSSSIENIDLVFNGGTFSIDSLDSTSNTENIDLIGNFIIDDLSSTTDIENIDLAQNSGSFIIASLDSSSDIDNITLEEIQSFEISDIDTTTSIENIALVGNLIIDNLESTSDIENILLYSTIESIESLILDLDEQLVKVEVDTYEVECEAVDDIIKVEIV